MAIAGLREIQLERPNYGGYYKRHTWLYRGFIINNWQGFFCVRPCEVPMDKQMQDLLVKSGLQPHNSHMRHKVITYTGSLEMTDCLESKLGESLDDVCHMIDTFWVLFNL